MNTKDNSNRALILSGGGARGAYQVGVWKLLQEMGWQPDLVCGTSIGSVNGTFIGMGWDAARLEQFWYHLAQQQVFNLRLWQWLKYRSYSLFSKSSRWPSYLDNKPMRRLLEQAFDWDRLRHSPTKVVVTATNVCKARLEYFSSEELDIDHIMASCSIPLVFPWQPIGDQLYWDGGIMANTPMLPAFERGAREIVVVLLAPLVGEPIPPPDSRRAALGWVIDIITIASVEALLYTFAYQLGMDRRAIVDAINEHYYLEVNETRIAVVAPKQTFGISSILNLSETGIQEMVAAGYADAQEQLVGFRKALDSTPS